MNRRKSLILAGALIVAGGALVTGLFAAHGHGTSPLWAGSPHADHFERVFRLEGAFLGVLLEDTEEDGVRVAGVAEDSPAEAAGLREGDVVTAVDGEEVRRAGDLVRHVRSLEPGDEVEIEVSRNGERHTVIAELGERDRPLMFSFGGDADLDLDLDLSELHEHLGRLGEHLGSLPLDLPHGLMFERHGRPRLGVQVVETTPELRLHLGGPEEAGVLVGRVLRDSPAEEAGLQVGDLIVRAGDREIRDRGDLVRALYDLGGGSITLEVVRGGRSFTLDAILPEEEPEPAPRGGPARRPAPEPAPSATRA